MAISKTIKHPNLTAYDNYEKFDDVAKLEEYRKNKISSASSHVSFIKDLCGDRSLSVLELGSGNSKTLYALEKEHMLTLATGVEVSEDRHAFAEKWKADWGFTNVFNKRSDFTQLNIVNLERSIPGSTGFDLVLCVDLAFQFIEPLKLGEDKRIISDIFTTLKQGGKIILEFDRCERMIDYKTGEKRIWEEFSEPDPWKYSLWDCKYDSNSQFLQWDKTFINRDMSETSKSSITIRIYSLLQVISLLTDAGFINVKYHNTWTSKPSLKKVFESEGEFIVTAEKPNE